jgi:hypothetical protein
VIALAERPPVALGLAVVAAVLVALMTIGLAVAVANIGAGSAAQDAGSAG